MTERARKELQAMTKLAIAQDNLLILYETGVTGPQKEAAIEKVAAASGALKRWRATKLKVRNVAERH